MISSYSPRSSCINPLDVALREGFELGAILGFLLQQQAQACPDDFAAILIAAGLHQLVDILLQRIGKDDVSRCHEVLQAADS